MKSMRFSLMLSALLTAASAIGELDTVVGDFSVKLQWEVMWDEQYILFAISTDQPLPSWFLLGFSSHGLYNYSDFCLVEGDRIVDGWTDNAMRLRVDRSQDCELVSISERRFLFRRRFSTCDPKDYAIETGTTQIVLAYSTNSDDRLSSPTTQKTLVYTLLLDSDAPPTPAPKENTQTFDIVADKAHIPAEVTTYWCVVQELPPKLQKQKHHVTMLEAVIHPGNEHIVHHMEVFLCIGSSPSAFSGNCNDPHKPRSAKSCSKVVAAWAMGEGAVVLPPEAGLPLGGEDAPHFVMVEIHYNNVEKEPGRVDSSGIRFHVTQQLREHDAGIIELGLIYSDANSIPPGQSAFPITAYCTADCTSKFPDGGISVFASQLHAHLTGRRLWTSHYRGGVKIGELNRDDHYTPHWQHLQSLRPVVQILPGDVLATTCVYDTTARDKITLGGYGIEDEMCVNYIYYYPLSDVEVCKSAVDNATLHRYFDSHGVRSHSISKAYQNVHWTRDRVESLHELYSVAPLNQHCLQHDGSLFPGHPTNWTRVPRPPVWAGPFDKRRAVMECPSISDE